MSVPFLVYMCYSGSTNQVPLLVKHMAVIPEPRLCTIMKYCPLEISGNGLRYLHRQIFNILFCPQNLSTVSSDDVI